MASLLLFSSPREAMSSTKEGRVVAMADEGEGRPSCGGGGRRKPKGDPGILKSLCCL